MRFTEICFINKSMSSSPVDAILFEPAVFFDSSTQRLPLLYIEHCPHDFSHPFIYDHLMSIQLRDAYGNFSTPLEVKNGYQYIIEDVKGITRLTAKKSVEPSSIEVFNSLPQGAPDIILSRGKKNTAIRSGLAPGEFFMFNIPDKFLARKISSAKQAARLQQMETDGYSTIIRTKDISRGELVLTGGGTGLTAKKYEFNFYKDSFL
jgi:hypothetical protein